MASPFPGMDPYFEEARLWPLFQHQLVNGLYQILLPGLMDRYRARVSQRLYITEQVLFTSILREEHCEEFIEVRQRSDGKLVTLIEVVSPTNKTSDAGRQAYLGRRSECKAAGSSVVEIDLVLQGQSSQQEYAVTVTRATLPERPEIYPTTLQKRLPRFRLPLAADDRDTVLDLQAAFGRCFEQGGFAAKIDYGCDPATTLTEENRTWLDALLKQQKLR